MTMPTLILRYGLLLLLIAFAHRLCAQVPPGLTQNVRGTVLDTDTRQPVFGAAVLVVGSDPVRSAMADEEGRFILRDVPVGRVDLRIRAMGYQEVLLPQLLVTSAKEVVVQVGLESSISEMQEVSVSADRKPSEVRNDMAVLSVRTIGVEETSRIAGGINDPARMVTVFPGVAGDATGNNTIMVRGNSPKGVLWRLEGLEIPSPNHFSDEGSTGGPINVLNSDMLDDSEFYTGAFPAEYGNALSAVYDMRLRNGNDREREYTLKVGVLGTDLTAEGPVPGLAGGSYLANYRYSTLSLLDQAGIVDYGGVPNYTDAAFKLRLPAGKVGSFSVFGLGGKSHILQDDRGVRDDTLFARADAGSRMGVVGVTHTRTVGDNSYVQTSLSYGGNGSGTDYEESPVPGESPLELRHQDDLARWTLRATTTFNTRINNKHKLRSGIIASFDRYRMQVDSWDEERGRMDEQLQASGSATTWQAFSSWKWRWNERWTMTSGVHLLHFALNGATSVEPRLGLRFQQRPQRAFTLGGGLHGRVEPIMTYLAIHTAPDGSTSRPNTQLGISKAAHAVMGMEQLLAEDLQLKVEAYFQHHFHVPVENDPTSSYSLSNNAEWFTTRPLVARGGGRNFGLEVGLEKYFTRGYHYLISASWSDARYKALDGIWRNSRWNMGVVANALAGKEWKVGRNGKDRTLTTGVRWTMVGGQYSSPIDLQASIATGEEQVTAPYWSRKGAAIHKLDMVVSYRIGGAKASHEIKVDVQNVLNSATTVYTYYDRRNARLDAVPQLALLPVLQYTLRF